MQLVGPPGVGKSARAQVLSRQREGAILPAAEQVVAVDLHGLSHRHALGSQILSALGLHVDPAPQDAWASAVIAAAATSSERATVLLLDGLDAVQDDAAASIMQVRSITCGSTGV